MIATELSAQNTARRAVELQIFDHACAMAVEQGMTGPGRRAIVLADDGWHAGVVGIVCSRLTETFCRPAILMQRKDGVCHGSGRSIDGFNLHAALTDCAEHLSRFGGHDMAAGLHMADAHLQAFTEAFIECANRRINDGMLRPSVRFDCEADTSELTVAAVTELEKLGPFGRGNPEVAVLVRNMRIAQPARTMGATGRHVALHLRGEGSGMVVRCVAWNWAEHAPRLREGSTVDAVLKPRVSEWSGRKSVEPEMLDIRLHANP